MGSQGTVSKKVTLEQSPAQKREDSWVVVRGKQILPSVHWSLAWKIGRTGNTQGSVLRRLASRLGFSWVGDGEEGLNIVIWEEVRVTVLNEKTNNN